MYLEKKVCLITATVCGLVTAFWVAARCANIANIQELGRYYALAVPIITCLQFAKKSKKSWSWGNIIFVCAFYFVLAGVMIIKSEVSALYWCFALWAVGFAVCTVFVIVKHKQSQK